MIAGAALFVSVGTTYVDLRRSNIQDRHAAGLELTDLVQRLVALPRQLASSRAAGEDPELFDQLRAGFSQEKRSLAGRAFEILQRYPNSAASTDYEIVAEALVTDIQGGVILIASVDRSIRLLEDGIERASDPEERASLLAQAGEILFGINDFARGRLFFKRSVEALTGHPSLLHLASYYEAHWGKWEAIRGQCDEAPKHLTPAREYLRKTGSSGSSDAIDDLARACPPEG